MLQVVVSRQYLFWIFISTLFTLMALISLAFPNWMLRTGSEIGRFNPCQIEEQPAWIGPIVLCDSYCTSTTVQFRCSWIWQDVLISRSGKKNIMDKITFVLLFSGSCFAIVANVLVVICSCKRAFKDINTFQVTGVLHFLSAITFIFILLIWAISWSTIRFRSICGAKSQLFSSPLCKTDWALFTFCLATIGLIFCGIFSLIVDKSISNTDVAQHLLIGNQMNFV